MLRLIDMTRKVDDTTIRAIIPHQDHGAIIRGTRESDAGIIRRGGPPQRVERVLFQQAQLDLVSEGVLGYVEKPEKDDAVGVARAEDEDRVGRGGGGGEELEVDDLLLVAGVGAAQRDGHEAVRALDRDRERVEDVGLRVAHDVGRQRGRAVLRAAARDGAVRGRDRDQQRVRGRRRRREGGERGGHGGARGGGGGEKGCLGCTRGWGGIETGGRGGFLEGGG